MTALISVCLGIFCLAAASSPKEGKEETRILLILLGVGLLFLSLGSLIV